MKYKNYLVNLLRGEEMLHFMQQFWISVDFKRRMLYLMQDFKPPTQQKAKMIDVVSRETSG
ncbi:hypothetical protein [Paenibacillus borealis]|uniref:Uncharacterized protein n=1 Tax=Paenibacillus borealis TaxID=160799 RepID=A0A089MGW1_PAEBO|nr:hypothetical protein [Paenibacillus borealis]AIQ55814.1 hypothetical protein PBOR_01655 [Paenibacillus borealis]